MLLKSKYIPFGKVSGIIHIGAHEAEELELYTACGVNHVLWVEANPFLHSILCTKIKDHANMHLGMFAAGNREGTTTLNIANNTQSSSILDLGTHTTSYPDIYYTSKVDVKLETVDNWITANNYDRKIYNLINLDIQGYELQALQGLTSQLPYVDFIYSEINFSQVYKGCSTVEALDGHLEQHGFHRVITCRTRNKEGWGDALYSRKALPLRQSLFRIEDFCLASVHELKLVTKGLVRSVAK